MKVKAGWLYCELCGSSTKDMAQHQRRGGYCEQQRVSKICTSNRQLMLDRGYAEAGFYWSILRSQACVPQEMVKTGADGHSNLQERLWVPRWAATLAEMKHIPPRRRKELLCEAANLPDADRWELIDAMRAASRLGAA